MREFKDSVAKRESVPLLVGLLGPSGGGKTMSALRLATGVQRVTGGDIGFIDTEARRSLHYAEKFQFKHLDFKAPFGPLDYLSAIRHFESKGVKTIIVDSMSHEHEGAGGVLDQHEIAMGGDMSKSMIAWAKPKKERRELINGILQMNCNFVFCFRAKEKVKPVRNERGKIEPKNQGYMPIAGEEFLFEMTVCALLLPRANGIPEWNPQESGERLMTKLPDQFFHMVVDESNVPLVLSEEIGEKLANWAKGMPTNAQSMRDAIKPPVQQQSASLPSNPPSEPCADLEEQQAQGPKSIEGEIQRFEDSKNNPAKYFTIQMGGKWFGGAKSIPALTAAKVDFDAKKRVKYRIYYTEKSFESNGRTGVNLTIVGMESC